MEHVRSVTREFETGDSAVLHVEARSGAVLVESHPRPTVRVVATIRVWSDHEVEADDAAALVSRAIDQDDQQRVIVRAPTLPQSEGWNLWHGHRSSRVDYTIAVPVRTAVRVLSRSGAVRVARTEGRVHVESGSGRASVEEVQGNVTVISRSGSIQADRIRGETNLETRSGRIDAHAIDGPLTMQARSGTVEARGVTGDLSARAHTGAVNLADGCARVYARTHTGAIRYSGRVQGDFDMKAHTGLIHLTVDADRPFYIDAESQVGTVRSDLAPRRTPGPSRPRPDAAPAAAEGAAPKVRLRTHTGAIRLSRL
jgi:DUF4097 and DUF4098 domain-containing protein YvlB